MGVNDHLDETCGVAQRWYTGRLVVVGSAATQISHYGTSALTMAIQDVVVLLNELMDPRGGFTPGNKDALIPGRISGITPTHLNKACRSYQRERRKVATEEVKFTSYMLKLAMWEGGLSKSDDKRLRDESFQMALFGPFLDRHSAHNADFLHRDYSALVGPAADDSEADHAQGS